MRSERLSKLYYLQERLIWCITEGEKRTFQLDITGCNTTDELATAAVAKSGFKINPKFKDLWVVRLIDSLLTSY